MEPEKDEVQEAFVSAKAVVGFFIQLLPDEVKP